MKIDSVLKEVLDEISLSNDEEKELFELAGEVVSSLRKAESNVEIGGSLAKGTLVKKDNQDVDVFVVFSKEENVGKLGGLLKKAGLKGKVVHGSRDYYQVDFSCKSHPNVASKDALPTLRAKRENYSQEKSTSSKVTFEIIPVVSFKKMEDVENVTDFSLSHVKYVKKKLKGSLRDEIKLAKTFCHACGCYGAESYIQGFSGYALEVLVIYFGGFVKFLKGVQKKTVIDVERLFKNDKEIMNEINASKLQSPLIVVDPTYKFRNVTAGLGLDTFERFVKHAQKFLKSPSVGAFVKPEFDVEKFKKSKGKFIELELRTDKQEGDIAGTKMKKFFRFLIKQLEKKEQKVLKRMFVYEDGQEAKGYLVVVEKKEIEVGGIDISMKDAVKGFKRVRGRVFVKKGKIWAKEKVSLNGIFESGRRVGEDMAVSFKIVN